VREAVVMHVVALSGGKDSTAMALRLAEIEPREYVYVCTPTGDELPEMFAHWRRLGDLLGRPILPVMGGTLKGRIEHWNALPNWRQRWCTRELKIQPYAAWLMRQPKPVISYVGLRADEPEREGGDYAAVPEVTMRFPMREWGWGIGDVYSYLDQRGISIPERTDCARCFFQTLGEWWRLWKDHPQLYADAEADEARTEHTFRSPGRDTWPAALSELRAEFERGRIPPGNPGQHDMFRSMQCRVCR
jgi:3'-phosphoadenosine 5'-phosphosulfate sulfotransferase (PAPS reductase)/FAD synthetase